MPAKPRPTPRKAAASKPRAAAAPGDMEPGVAAFFLSLDHPRKPEMLRVREIILGVSPRIGEGIKWNAPSFRTTDFFATMNVHRKDSVRLILHTGAKGKQGSSPGDEVEDPSGILERLAKDRCMVTIRDGADLGAKASALREIVRQWIGLL